MRLIDADALIHVLVSLKEDYKKEGSSYREKAVTCLIKILQHKGISPTIEAEPIRHGEWVTDDLGHTHCSRCGERLPFIHCYSDEPCSDYDEEWDEEIPETRCCPNCGATMDGGKKDGFY